MRVFFITLFTSLIFSASLSAKPPTKSKFYDFGDQVIDGEIKTPSLTFTTSRKTVRFNRLLKIKKSFLPTLYGTSRYKVFK